MKVDNKLEVGLQWHITTNCSSNCKHCYMKNSDYYESEKAGEISLEAAKKIVDSLVEFCRATNTRPHITFTGGDPLLRSDFFTLIEYIRKIPDLGQEFSLRILGNPFFLTKSLIRDFEKLGIDKYQMSLDGDKEFHDNFRGPGSFEATLSAYDLFEGSSIQTLCMFSLSKANAAELKKVMRIVAEHHVSRFAFARIVPFGNSARDVDFSPLVYRDFLADIFDYQSELKRQGAKTKFIPKDHLWTLFFYERGLKQIWPSRQIVDGCGMGLNTVSVLADGLVYACRRFISPIGKMPDESFTDIFLGNRLNTYRNIRKLEKCVKCELLKFCRGCPAVAWGTNGSYKSADPQCWKEV